MVPHPDWMKRRFSGPRSWETTDSAPFREVPTCSRGELRLAAEVALCIIRALDVPTYAHERASEILKVVAGQ